MDEKMYVAETECLKSIAKLKSERFPEPFSDIQAVFESNIDFNYCTIIISYEEMSELLEMSVYPLIYHLDRRGRVCRQMKILCLAGVVGRGTSDSSCGTSAGTEISVMVPRSYSYRIPSSFHPLDLFQLQIIRFRRSLFTSKLQISTL